MKPSLFTYHDPATLSDALGLLARLDNVRPLAGGQSLMAMVNMRFVQPDHIIDLNLIDELSGIHKIPGEIRIGATTRQCELEFSPMIAQDLPLLKEAILHVGHRQTRNRGTLGGSLCHLDPSAEMVTIAAAYDAVVEIASSVERREIKFHEFPLGFMMPSMAQNELLSAVRFPLWPPEHGHAFVEFSRRHGDFAIVSAAALILLDSMGVVIRASLTLGGVDVAPIRMTEIENLLLGEKPTDVLIEYASERCRGIEALSDALTTSEYRQSLAVVMAKRALSTACARAGQLR
ncbi:MAG: xanthine dehydrogenase family protein subunit M [Polaromonas sp.]|jgi:carbon-monoxide dehydrogenase medium subunit|nr:xanthine dehydrogenase family protein subunit M [Polaromonas sp.]